ncbi:hypothetical protein TEA_019739 [Camellia sinensis var. sinensis]|uniref:Uncharacterized protein n=1 Tax=Camellia sinensis var. sinensis TaxID=542762 RepID=A0A4S4F2N4_CAMSN|nr:hypothetical protein TEA_019739 [Camellia sinensis var. sinensis]
MRTGYSKKDSGTFGSIGYSLGTDWVRHGYIFNQQASGFVPCCISSSSLRVPAANSYDDFHKIFWVFIALLGSLLGTTYKPFETQYPKAVAFVATIAIYFISLIRDDFVKIVAEIRSIMNQLRNGNANGSQGEPNASAKESMGSSAVTMPVNVV